jgi:hypothetical protein
MDDADGPYFLAWREFTVVEADLCRFQGVDVDPQYVVLLRLVRENEVGSFCLLDDELGYLASLRRVLLAKEVLDGVEVVLAHGLLIHAPLFTIINPYDVIVICPQRSTK